MTHKSPEALKVSHLRGFLHQLRAAAGLKSPPCKPIPRFGFIKKYLHKSISTESGRALKRAGASGTGGKKTAINSRETRSAVTHDQGLDTRRKRPRTANTSGWSHVGSDSRLSAGERENGAAPRSQEPGEATPGVT